MLPQLLNMLTWWQWVILAAVPPAIIALYFLKLKRRPVEVPSTYLWHKSIEDLHVNTIWQRLRRNLLLLLQLLLVFLAMLAVLRPGWRSKKQIGQRSIFLVDNSASMQATDEEPSRLEEAKRQVHELIDEMDPGDVAMLVSFSESARVEQMFTSSPRQLRRALDAIQPTADPTSLAEALKVASGLANPGRVAYEDKDIQVADALPATLYIFSDGKFPDPAGFSLGNLAPLYQPIGAPEASNLGIVAFSVRRHETKAGQLQAFARLENFNPGDRSVSVELRLDGRLIDADQMEIPAGQSRGVAFDLGAVDSGVLNLRAVANDDLALDDEAWTVVNVPRRSKVLLVTPGNEPLEFALGTGSVLDLADLTIESPDFLEKKDGPYQQQADLGTYDLVVYDRCGPKKMPHSNTLFIGTVPPVEEGGQSGGDEEGSDEQAEEPKVWRAGPRVNRPQIIDTDPAHPLMQWMDLGDVLLADGTPLELPPGGNALVEIQWIGSDNVSHVAPVFAVAPREGFEDAVMGFVLIDELPDEDGKLQKYIGTNWPIRPSFPVFVLNLLHYLGGSRAALADAAVHPGQPVTLESPDPSKPLEVHTPAGKKVRLKEAKGGKFTFTETANLGPYEVLCGGKTFRHFAVNLFKGSESDIRPRPSIRIGREPVEGKSSGWESTRRETWKLLLLLGLAILLLEWYIYNRRVYM